MHRRAFLQASALSAAWGAHALGSPCPSRNDELWIIDSHGLGCTDPSELRLDAWRVQRREANTAWRHADLSDFWNATHDDLPTVVYVHGNRNDLQWAVRNGQAVHQALLRTSTPIQPLRFVIYAWPADQIHGPVRDARYKTQVSDGEIYRFGWWLQRVAPTNMVGMIGFSLGARIISGATHLLAGGSLFGKSLPAASRPAMRAAYIAPAMDCHWLVPGHAHSLSPQACDRVLVLYNSCDPVLRRYSKLDRRNGHEAMGYAGLSRGTPGNVVQRDAAPQVGKNHDLNLYLDNASLMHELRRTVLWGAA